MILKDVIYDAHYILSPNRELLVAQHSVVSCTEELLREERERAAHRGEEEGEKQGYAKAYEEVRHLISLLHTLANHMMEYKKHMMVQMKPEIIGFIFQVAEQIIHQELSQPEHYIKMLQALLNQAVVAFAGQPLHVFLAPEDLLRLEPHLNQLVIPSKQTLKFCADAKMRAGDCRLETEMGVLHADLARELSMLKAHVLCQSF